RSASSSNRHNLLVALTYFFVSSYWQSDPIKAFIRKAKNQNPSLYRRILLQYTVWGGAHLALLGVSIALHGLKTGLYVYVMTLLIPAFFALWTIMLFNYDQHVHTDPWSKHNHSRSWDGKLLNFLLFNNGLHCAHHENPGTHWSNLRADHAAIAPLIDPALIEHSLFWYWTREYFVAPFIPSLGSKQIGRAPFEAPDGAAVNLTSADVDVGEAGTNAQMVGS
ncbi:MAG TPA: fatty acid desaturase, partial [Polyangiaceae bacterium]|nr:fatty acid desaturase [Polyangiaceae bacterium]